MNFFSIRDVQNLTGIKAHTLRIWEQRHSILTPRRKKSNHRFYDNEDLKQLLRIAYLYKHGYKISRIAELSEEDISRLTLELRPDRENYGIFINQLTEATIDLDRARFEKTLDRLVEEEGIEQGVLEILFPFLRKIGHLWLAGSVMPAQEHFASALIIKKIIMAIDALGQPPLSGGRRVLLFAPHGEPHEIPLLFMQYRLRKNGIPTVYLGCNVKTADLKTICHHFDTEPDGQPITHLYFNLITHLLKTDLGSYLHQLSTAFPAKEVVFSGTRAGSYIACGIPANVHLLKGTEDLLEFSE